MKLSIFTSGYTNKYITDVCDIIRYYSKLGYHVFDFDWGFFFNCANGDLYGYADKVKEVLKETNTTLYQSHAPLYGNDAMDKTAAALVDCINIAGYLKIPYIVIHPMFNNTETKEEQTKRNVEFYSKFIPLLEKNDTNLCIENVGNFEDNVHSADAKGLSELIDAFNSDRIYACWDTGHANLRNLNQYDGITTLGKRLKAVHIHDSIYPFTSKENKWAPDLHNFPLFGNINFDAVVQGLIDIGFEGPFNIETDMPNRRGHLDFVYNGNVVLKLKPIPFWLREDSDKMLYKIGKYILETYDIFEE